MSDNITLPREVVEGALEALDSEHPDIQLRAAIALRTALAAEQPKPEPVAWMRKEWSPDCGSYFDFCAEEEMGWRDRKEWTPLYAAPPDAEALRQENERLRELLLDIRKDAATSHWHRDIDAAMEDKT